MFKDCKRLKKVILPNGLTYISDRAFYECKSLKKISLPDSLTSIGEDSFFRCINLEEIHFPENLSFIFNGYEDYDCRHDSWEYYQDSFEGCDSLRRIFYYQKTEEILKKTFRR